MKISYKIFVYNILTEKGRNDYEKMINGIANHENVILAKEETHVVNPQTIYKIIETRTEKEEKKKNGI